jgi:hypothetical protein
MAVYKVPRMVQFVDALPKSGSGKVMWRALQERCCVLFDCIDCLSRRQGSANFCSA